MAKILAFSFWSLLLQFISNAESHYKQQSIVKFCSNFEKIKIFECGLLTNGCMIICLLRTFLENAHKKQNFPFSPLSLHCACMSVGNSVFFFFKLAAPMHVLFFKVARSPFKQKYGSLLSQSKLFARVTYSFSFRTYSTEKNGTYSISLIKHVLLHCHVSSTYHFQ